jgi:RNA polymerase sigma-70 factor (ECF subfamily)
MISDANCDKSLVQLAQQGENRAFDYLVTKYRRRLMRTVLHVIPNRPDAEDAVQEIFIRAFRALDSFRGDASFYTWLYRIAINVSKNYWSRTQRYALILYDDFDGGSVDGCTENLVEMDTPELIFLRNQFTDALLLAIDRLPTDFRTALILRAYDGLSYKEISKIMKCPVGTVRSRVFRARKITATCLAITF